MATTQRDRMRAYRARRKASLGAAEYKREEAENRKQRRERARDDRLESELLEPSDEEDPNNELERDVSCKDATKQMKDIIDILQEKLDGTRELTIPQIRTIVVRRAPKVLTKLENAANCEQLVENVYQAKKLNRESMGKQYKRKSAEKLIDAITRLHEYMTGADRTCTPPDFEFTKDTSKVLDFIYNRKQWQDKTKQTYIERLAGLLGVLEGYEDAYKVYSDTSVSGPVRKRIEEQAGYSKLSPKEAENYLDWSVLLTAHEAPGLTHRQKALVSMYTLFPPRRNEDYGKMKIARVGDNVSDKEFNYLLLTKAGKPTEFVFNRYKTDFKFDQQRWHIDKDFELVNAATGTTMRVIDKRLSSILATYIKSSKLKVGAFLIGANDGEKAYEGFSYNVSRAFYAATSKTITANLCRHAIISALYETNPTEKEKEVLAEMMAHKVSTQAKYNRITQKVKAGTYDALSDSEGEEGGPVKPKAKSKPKPKPAATSSTSKPGPKAGARKQVLCVDATGKITKRPSYKVGQKVPECPKGTKPKAKKT